MIDIGGGTTDIAVFTEGSVRHTAVIPIAGDQVTNDIAVALRIPARVAEEIKLQHSCAFRSLTDENDMIDVPMGADRPERRLSKRTLAEVVEARYEELFNLVAAEIRRSGFEDSIPAGIVLTGGAARVKGAVDLAEQVFKMPVRIGVPQHVTGLPDVMNNPVYATGVGLLLYGLRAHEGLQNIHSQSGLKSVWSRMKGWFQGNF